MVTSLSVYASMAHTIISEHLRPQLVGSTNVGSLGFASRCWDAALFAYGKSLYELPTRVNIPQGTTREWVDGKATYVPQAYLFKTYTAPRMLTLGISPLEMYSYTSVSETRTSYTPIHIATALLRFHRTSYEKMALALLDPAFLRQYAKMVVPDLTSMKLNPYTPEDFGLSRLPFEPGEYVDEIGNLAWFSREYAEKLYEGGRAREGLARLIQLCVCHNLWWHLCDRGAKAALYAGSRTDNKAYANSALYLRLMSPLDARKYLKEVEGVREVLWAVRKDMTAEEMRRGLAVIAQHDSKPIRAMLPLIGRELTIEDIRALSPKQALTILYNAPLDAVKGLRPYGEELGSMFFAIKDAPIVQVQRCLSEHPGRTAIPWKPDTNEGIAQQAGGKLRATEKEEWDKNYGDLITKFVQAYEWRNDVLEACDPDTAFLSLLLKNARPEDSFASRAVESVLNTHPNIARVRDLMSRIPEHLGALKDRLGQ